MTVLNYIFYILTKIWGLGIGDWGLGIGDWAPIPNPQSPIPTKLDPFLSKLNQINLKHFFRFYFIPYLTNYILFSIY